MDMKDKEPKIHPLVRVGSTLTALALAASQVGCKPLGVESPPPEGTQARSTEVVPPLSSTVEVAAPVSIQPMVEETPVAGATSTPESVSPAVWAPPTLEQMAVTGYGGELSPDVAVYEFDKVIPTGLARVGIENTTVNFSNNGLSGDAYRWAPLTVNPEGLVIWAYDPAIGQLEWPVKLDPLVDAAGNTYYRLRTEGLSYQAVPDSEGAQIVWGGTKDGKSGEYLAILARDPITLPDGKQIYSTYWDCTSQSWLPTPGLAEITPPEPTVTPESSVWQVAGKDYLVSLGENNIPEYQFVEGEDWQKVEQVSMVDAFGNTVPGWVVEKSDVWEGEISQTSDLLISGKHNPNSGLSFALMSNVTLKQWQLMEFINSDGIKMQRLNLTWVFKNDQGKVITVKAGMPELNWEARTERLTPRQFMDSLIVGGQTQILSFYWVDTMSAMTPEKLAELSNQNAIDGDLCKLSVQACGLSIGRLGEVKHPTSWFDEIYHGLYGDNINIVDEGECQRYNE